MTKSSWCSSSNAIYLEVAWSDCQTTFNVIQNCLQKFQPGSSVLQWREIGHTETRKYWTHLSTVRYLCVSSARQLVYCRWETEKNAATLHCFKLKARPLRSPLGLSLKGSGERFLCPDTYWWTINKENLQFHVLVQAFNVWMWANMGQSSPVFYPYITECQVHWNCSQNQRVGPLEKQRYIYAKSQRRREQNWPQGGPHHEQRQQVGNSVVWFIVCLTHCQRQIEHTPMLDGHGQESSKRGSPTAQMRVPARDSRQNKTFVSKLKGYLKKI